MRISREALRQALQERNANAGGFTGNDVTDLAQLYGVTPQSLRRRLGDFPGQGKSEREAPRLPLNENLRSPRYVRWVYGSLCRQAARFAMVSEEALVTAKTLTGLSGEPPMVGNNLLPK